MSELNITSFEKYIDYLPHLNDVIICVAVRDTAGFYLTPDMVQQMKTLGIKTNFKGAHQKSYAAIICGDAVYERLSETPVRLSKKINDFDIVVESKGFHVGDSASIIVSGLECSINYRGFNFVVIDLEFGRIVDAVAFDTHSSKKTCIRPFNSFEYENTVCHFELARKIVHNLSVNDEIKKQWAIFGKTNLKTVAGCDCNEIKANFFKKYPRAVGSLRTYQNACFELLRIFNNYCKKYGIRYWLDCGTLLGAVRHNGFVPWDDDIDIGMLRDDYEKFCNILNEIENPSIGVANGWIYGSTGPHRRVVICFKGTDVPFIDVFLHDICDSSLEWEEQAKRRKAMVKLQNEELKKLGHPCTYGPIYWKFQPNIEEIFKAHNTIDPDKAEKNYVIWSIDNFTPEHPFRMTTDVIMPFKTMMFEGLEVPVPNRFKKVLEFYYGDYYTIPRDMFNHKHVNVDELDEHCNELLMEYSAVDY